MNFALGTFFLFQLLFSYAFGKQNCDEILCSNYFDPVCGLAIFRGRTSITKKFFNVCHFSKIRCHLGSLVDIKLVEERYCEFRKPVYYPTRRATDFGIIGAQKNCNHTCPTYCRDTYDPACAKIWKRDMLGFTSRVMVNHCHIDLFSCVTGVNVTIQPLSKCFNNPTGLMFMSHIAALKSLQLLDD